MLYNWLQNISFAYVWVLPALILLPVIVWLYYKNNPFIKSAFKISTAEAFNIKTGKNYLIHFPFWLRLLALASLILALARPQIINTDTKTKGEGIDIILCLDVSGSMLSQDFLPNRIEVAKAVAADFVQQRRVDQIGIVIFSGESFTLSPLTSNHTALLEQIKGLRSGMLQDGTLIGEGLATSVQRLNQSKSASKVIILLTDGKEEAPDTRIIDPITALDIAKAKGVKVYTIGMAAVPGASRARMAYGGATTALDEGLLRRIASETGGIYFRATDRNRLQDVYDQIDRLEKSTFERVTTTRIHEQFFYLVMAALFFLLVELILRYTYLRTFP
ncbi:MAG TPA: VWA domain-containing protein [Flavisolibacter sp.]|nr:VWA domain-containing protein [Flavisolibacter sp.]